MDYKYMLVVHWWRSPKPITHEPVAPPSRELLLPHRSKDDSVEPECLFQEKVKAFLRKDSGMLSHALALVNTFVNPVFHALRGH
jgi:hypothetical protein